VLEALGHEESVFGKKREKTREEEGVR